MLDEVLFLTPDNENGPENAATDWPVPATDPPIMIPGINADGCLYPIEKIEAHVKGTHHLAISVFVFDGDALFIQRRALGKYHCGGMWANTCCTHPHFGEEVQQAAARRLNEELGFTVPLRERLIVEYSADVGGGLWERERVHMFRADVDRKEIKIDINQDEVCETKWVTPKQLRADMKTSPSDYTPWFRIYVNRYPELNF